jgi:hypothetical protein
MISKVANKFLPEGQFCASALLTTFSKVANKFLPEGQFCATFSKVARKLIKKTT